MTDASNDSRKVCREDDPKWCWPCSCDACCRQAAASWNGYMDRVFDGSLSLDEANRLADSDPSIAPRGATTGG